MQFMWWVNLCLLLSVPVAALGDIHWWFRRKPHRPYGNGSYALPAEINQSRDRPPYRPPNAYYRDWFVGLCSHSRISFRNWHIRVSAWALPRKKTAKERLLSRAMALLPSLVLARSIQPFLSLPASLKPSFIQCLTAFFMRSRRDTSIKNPNRWID